MLRRSLVDIDRSFRGAYCLHHQGHFHTRRENFRLSNSTHFKSQSRSEAGYVVTFFLTFISPYSQMLE
jgi:hypothetical protein